VAWWDGTAWGQFGWGIDGAASAVTTWDPDGAGPLSPELIVGGSFVYAGADSTGQIEVDGLARWNGTRWESFAQPFAPANFTAMTSFSPAPGAAPWLVVWMDSLRYWDGNWHSLPTTVTNVTALATFDFDGSGPDPERLLAVGVQHNYMFFPDEHGGGTWVETSHYPAITEWNGSLSYPLWSDWQTGVCSIVTAIAIPGGTTLATGRPSAPYVEELVEVPAAVITRQPSGGSARLGGSISCSIEASAPGTFAWYRQVAAPPSTSTQRLVDGPQVGGGYVSGASTPTLTVSGITRSLTIGGSSGPYLLTGFLCEFTDDACHIPIDSAPAMFQVSRCSADFNRDGAVATDADIEAFFACIAGSCCATCDGPDFNGDGGVATDADIESFFRVLAGGAC
jgi:hypothetical protein